MKKSVFFIIIMIMLGSCNGSKNEISTESDTSIHISGKLQEGEGQLVTIDLMMPTEFVPLDSVRCDADGKFSFDFSREGMNFYAVKYTEKGYITVIASPGDSITLSAGTENVHPYNIEGSQASILIKDLSVEHKNTLDLLKAIANESANITGHSDYSTKKQILNDRFDSITTAFNKYSKDFIHKNPSSPAILIALYNQYGPGVPVFNPLDDFAVYKFVDSSLYKHYPENDAVKSLHSQLEIAIQKIQNQSEKAKLETGMRAPDFVSTTPEGNNLALSDINNKPVLIQVWASWSKPSLDEFPYLKECKKKYGEKINVLMVSIDDNKESWEEAINKLGSGFFHVSDLQRWECAFVNLYRLERIPANFLLNQDGIILESDIFGDELIPTVEKYIN